MFTTHAGNLQSTIYNNEISTQIVSLIVGKIV